MKKTTGIIFLIAAALAAFVYFYDLKHTKSNAGADELGLDASSGTADNSKPAFAIAAPDIASLTVERAGKTATFEQRDGTWYMVQPLATRADQSVVGAIASELASDGVTRTLSAGAGGLATLRAQQPERDAAIRDEERRQAHTEARREGFFRIVGVCAGGRRERRGADVRYDFDEQRQERR